LENKHIEHTNDEKQTTYDIKVVITGPECCGKTTLASALAKHYSVPLVEEYARTYLNDLGIRYDQNDLLKIALGQLENESKVLRSHPSLMICDTGLYIIKVWSIVKYGRVDYRLKKMLDHYACDLFILPNYNIPYVKDELRENPKDRQSLYGIYLEELMTHGQNFIQVNGGKEERLAQAIEQIDSLSNQSSKDPL